MMDNFNMNTLSANRNKNPKFYSTTDTVFLAFDENDLRQTFAILKRKSLVISGIVVVVNCAVAYSTLKQEPIYQGNFQILVESLNKDNSLEKLNLLNPNISKPGLDYESQIQIINNPEQLQNINSAVAYSTLKQDPIYQGNFKILVESLNENNSLKKLNSLNVNISKLRLDYESQIQVLKSTKLLQNVIKKLQESYPEITYDSLMEGLTISRFGQTKIIEVNYQSHDTQKIKAVLNTISKSYLEYSLNKRQMKLHKRVEFVEKQLPNIQKRVLNLRKEMQIFCQKYNFINPVSQSEIIYQQIQFLTEKRLILNQQLAAARSNYLNLQGEAGQLTAINNSPLYQQLISQYQQLDIQISGELARFQVDQPVIQTLQEKRDNLLPIIQNEAKRALTIKINEATLSLQKVEVDSQQLVQAEQQLQQKLAQLPVLSRQYTDIQRNLQLANESLNQLLINREQSQVEQIELPWELIQAPTQSEFPISPDTPRSLLLGLVASSLLGVSAASLLEKIDNTYQSVERIKENIEIPLLATLPFDKNISYQPSPNVANSLSDQKIFFEDRLEDIGRFSNILSSKYSQNRYYGQGAFWESLQVLYENIQLLNSDQPIRSLIISSVTPGDGKSTVSFHLAKTAASMGKRVLLVDGDLRCSQIHKLSRLNNLRGLSNLISSNINVEQVTQQMPQFKDLFVITAGSVPPDPARLLSSNKMKQMMDYFHQNFDLVIYDAPPMLGLVDARMLAPYTDGLILVVRIGKTDKLALKQVENNLKIAPINLLGLVINGDKAKLPGYNYYHDDYQQRVNEDKNKLTISNL